MENLAGNLHAAETVRNELIRCGIPIVEAPDQMNHPDVKVPIMGKLGNFEFRRYWYYYSVKGLVPLAVARKLYDHPVGRNDIRVEGHCGCPAPEGPYIQYYRDGKLLTDVRGRSQHEKILEPYPNIAKTFMETHCWSENPAAEGQPFINGYDIDSELGLYIFVQALHDFVTPVVKVTVEESSD